MFTARSQFILVLTVLCWTGCSRMGPNNTDEEKNGSFQRGKSLVNSLDYPAAIEAFEKALQDNPKSAAAHFELGLIYYQHISDYAAAIYHFENFLRLRPLSPHADTVRQFITVSKQELAKTVSLGPVTQKVLRDLDELRRENLRLRQQIDALSPSLAAATNRPIITQTAQVPVISVPASTSGPPPTNSNPQPDKPPQPERNPSPPARAARAARTHTVKAGETMTIIARHYGVSLSALQAANPGVEPRRMQAGQTLKIPGS
jgi:LysM repeat protein